MNWRERSLTYPWLEPIGAITQENNLTFQAFFSELRSLFSDCRAIFLEVQAFFSDCRAIFLEVQAFFSECRANFSELHALFSDCDPLSLVTGAKRLKKSDLGGGTLRFWAWKTEPGTRKAELFARNVRPFAQTVEKFAWTGGRSIINRWTSSTEG